MRTSVSIPDDVFSAAEQLATRLSISRSELYARVVSAFVAAQDDRWITKALDDIYGREKSTIDPPLIAAQLRAVDSSEW